MATERKLRRGTELEHQTFTGASGELTAVTDVAGLRLHDGVTAGGHSILTEARGSDLYTLAFDTVNDMLISEYVRSIPDMSVVITYAYNAPVKSTWHKVTSRPTDGFYLSGVGCFLALDLSGDVYIEEFGAVGDGSLDLVNLPAYSGTDSTNAIQTAVNLLISKELSTLHAGEGIFNFTDLKFYDSTENLGKRGNFTFKGSGKTNPVRLIAGAVDSGTTFKCTSLSGSFDVNSVGNDGTNLIFNESSNAVNMEGFNVIGNTTSDLTKFDLVVGHSSIKRLSLVNYANTGRAMYLRSNYTTVFESIEGRGLTGNRLGYGLYYDTDFGAGSMATFTSVTFSNFGDTWYIGHTDINAPSHGGVDNANTFDNCQGQHALNGLRLGKVSSEPELWGQRTMRFTGCYFEICDTTNITVGYDASAIFYNCVIAGGTVDLGNVLVNNEQSTNTVTGGSLIFESNRISTAAAGGDKPFLTLPEGSNYSVTSRNNVGRTYSQTVFKMPELYNGVLLCQNDSIEGMASNSRTYLNHPEYLHPQSIVTIQRNWNTGNDGGSIDLSNRPYLPRVSLIGTLSASSSLTLPSYSPTISAFAETSIIKRYSANTLTLQSADANIYVNGLIPAVTSVAIRNVGYPYAVTMVDEGSKVAYYVSTTDPDFSNYKGLPSYADNAAAVAAGLQVGLPYTVSLSDPRQLAVVI